MLYWFLNVRIYHLGQIFKALWLVMSNVMLGPHGLMFSSVYFLDLFSFLFHFNSVFLHFPGKQSRGWRTVTCS